MTQRPLVVGQASHRLRMHPAQVSDWHRAERQGYNRARQPLFFYGHVSRETGQFLHWTVRGWGLTLPSYKILTL